MPIATPITVTNVINGANKGLENGSLANTTRKADEEEQPKYTATSYPSNCLQFLQDVSHTQAILQKTHDNYTRASKVKLDILIVGAGLGGLATAVALRRTGHDVMVFEQAPALMEVGAGIQIPPNSGKLLERWGVVQRFAKHVVQPAQMNFRRWENGALIGVTETSPEFTIQYGAPYFVVHRAHLHNALYEQAVALGVKTRLNSKVDSYDAETATIVISDGGIFQGDLVIAADGVKSEARALVSPGGRGIPKSTGFAVYRATVDVERMKPYPELAWILEKHNLNLWIGEDRHVMTYSIAGGHSFNMVLSHRDKDDPAKFGLEDDILGDMKREFEGWDEQLTKIISLIDKTMKTPLMSGSALENWVSRSSKLMILGDAAHAMVPYMSQGAAMAVEDGAALAVALSKITSIKELKFALSVFEKERVKRSSMMQEASMVNSMIWHFKDGPLQQARDAAMKAEVEGKHFLSSPNQWSDPVTQSWAYGYDAEKAMEEAWDAALHELILEKTA